MMSYSSGCCYKETFENITEKISRFSNIFLYAFEHLCPNKLNRIDLYIKSKTTQGINFVNKTLLFYALPRKPSIVPVVDVGSFFIDNNDKVHIYWKKINKFDFYGENFTMHITNELDHTTHQLNNEQRLATSSYTFEKDWLNTTSGAKLKLHASNIFGPAINASWIEIPSKDRLCGKPENIQVYKVDKSYYVSWTEPIGNYNITSYTVFWCTSTKDTLTQCEAPVKFERFNERTLKFNLTDPDNNLKFAISANTENSSSGMTWEQCKAETNPNLIGQIEKLQSTVDSTNKITIKWETKCKDRLIVKNYILEYCAVKDMISSCIGTIKTHITNSTSYSIDHLEPNTMYKFNVTMLSATTRGSSSTPLHYKTELPGYITFIAFICV